MAKKLSRMLSKYAGGGKPIGSTGLFENGGTSDYKMIIVNGHKIKWSKVYEKWQVSKAGKILEEFSEKEKAIEFAKNNKTKYSAGGKPIGSTGLFEKGGNLNSRKTFRVFPGNDAFEVKGVYLPYLDIIADTEEDTRDMAKKIITSLNKNNSVNTISSIEQIPEFSAGGKPIGSTGLFKQGGWTGNPINSGDVTQPVYMRGGKPIGSTGLFAKGGQPKKGRTVKIKVYQFDELDEKAQQKALEHFYDINVDYEWWEWMYEDAERAGIKITSFDIDRREINGEFTDSATIVAEKIMEDHGPDSETYKIAKKFMEDYDALPEEESTDELENEFQSEILEEYLDMLRKEYEYKTSKEAIIETIKAKELKFREDGRFPAYQLGGKPIGSTGLFEKGGVADYDNPQKYDDYDLAHDIELFAENDEPLYRQRYVPIVKNLKKKKDKGTFNEELAAVLWKTYFEDADKRYQKQVMDKESIKGYVLSVNDRKLLSAKMAHWVGSVAHDNDLNLAKGGKLDDANLDQLFREVTDYGETAIDDFVGDNNGFGYDNYYERRTEEVDHKPSSGFIPFTDGGVESSWFEHNNYLIGSGRNLPTNTLQKEVERRHDEAYHQAVDRFKQEYPSIVEKIGEDNIGYTALQEEGFHDEAERFDEFVREWLDDDTIMMRAGFYLYRPNNSRAVDRKPTCYVFGIVNMEAPYHREGNMEDFVEDEFTFHNLEGFKKKLAKSLEKIKAWFERGSYDQGRELVIRRMALGGMSNDDISGKMIRIVNPMTTDNTLGAHAGSPITSQDAV
jgi:hypothetical protein